jgi:hypothetical protein
MDILERVKVAIIDIQPAGDDTRGRFRRRLLLRSERFDADSVHD